MLLFQEYGSLLLDTAGYDRSKAGAHTMLPVMHILWVPLIGHCGGKGWQNHCKTTVSPWFGRLFLVRKRTIYFFWGGWWFGCFTLGRPRHSGPGNRFFIPLVSRRSSLPTSEGG